MPGKRQRWYAIAEPIRDVYDSYERCLQDLEGRPGIRRGPVEVSSAEEGWAILNGGVKLKPGLYAFTDANALGGVGVVIVRMAHDEGADPEVLSPRDSSVLEVFDRAPIGALTRGQVAEALRRLRNIVAEMVALYEALNELIRLPEVAPGSEVTIVHDYFGVASWMEAEVPPGSTMLTDHAFSDLAFVHREWRPAKDAAISAVVRACRQVEP